MVLVDTSVWIRFLRNQAPYSQELDRLLEDQSVCGHNLVYGELLIGDTGGRLALLTEYSRLPHALQVPHSEVVAFVRHRRLHGRGASWIDIHLLASAAVDGLHLWTADPRLQALTSELGLAHTINR